MICVSLVDSQQNSQVAVQDGNRSSAVVVGCQASITLCLTRTLTLHDLQLL